MKDTLITQGDLDVVLDVLAQDPDNFEAEARALALAWNLEGLALGTRTSDDWRKPAVKRRATGVLGIEDQLRQEIDSFTIMDRLEEAQHARRIEFARLLLEGALEAAGLEESDLEGAVSYNPGTFRDLEPGNCSLPDAVCGRWVELHALRTEVVERNLYLVLINVERYAHLGLGRLDLIQEGSATLFRAVDGFDWRRGLLFRTYAVHWLNQAFRSHLYNFGQTVRVPVYLQKAMKHVKAAKDRLGDPNASAEAIAEEAGLRVNLVESALAATRSTLSMDVPMAGGEEGGGLADILGEAEPEGLYSTDMEDSSLSEGLEDALVRLSDRERYVVELRFGLSGHKEHTLAEVAGKLGVSLERIRQIQVRAIGKMRTPVLRKAIDPFL
ncbi:MAG: RNA polymerase sigma factor (sigma-70 family) [Planctomycetota bacterium]|jgi:RNA polymerase sigma factor (sigma-70 family)